MIGSRIATFQWYGSISFKMMWLLCRNLIVRALTSSNIKTEIMRENFLIFLHFTEG